MKNAFLVVVIGLLFCSLAYAQPSNQPRCGLFNALERFHPDQPAPSAHVLQVNGAKGEWVDWQIVLTAGNTDLDDVRVESAPFRSPHKKVIPAPLLFREHFIRIVKSSPRTALKPGWYPDALLPLQIPSRLRLPGTPRYVGEPFTVKASKTQPLYAEIFIPRDTVPGVYEGFIKVTPRNTKPFSMKISLRVWNFSLPLSPSCQSDFGGFNDVPLYHGMDPSSTDAYNLRMKYVRALMTDRLMPNMPQGAVAPTANDGTPYMSKVAPVLKDYFVDQHANSLELYLPISDPLGKGRDRAIRYLKGYYAYLADHGWGRYAYTYLIDEPNDRKAYEDVRELSKMVHEADPRILFLCTEQPIPDNPAWGSLIGAVNIWCPLWALWDNASIQERLDHGDKVWSYTALTQGKTPTPFWETDFPLLNYRIASWQNWITGSTGLLYWSTVYWKKGIDPWTEPATYENYNGEGMLFYPGTEAGVNGPIESLRIKAIRDGMQDYDYFTILAKRKGRKYVNNLVRQVASDWNHWNADPNILLKIRNKIGEMISKATNGWNRSDRSNRYSGGKSHE